ncbi:hypothetical protein QFC22_006562 [Naganishia vaughanmartiniae]|uniref:Uncharacterized protein n=1 Tax=Naganishia vaughanmartiniae TaxID=1424756 RepID=A0ACC2WI05_9TREE|nr:hypothetical protein QFC22_006562 [Naganishia vaughanmartiniae]
MLPYNQVPGNLDPRVAHYRPPLTIVRPFAIPSQQSAAIGPTYPYSAYIGPASAQPSVPILPTHHIQASQTPAAHQQQVSPPTIPTSSAPAATSTNGKQSTASTLPPSTTPPSKPPAKAGKKRMRECRERAQGGPALNSAQYEQDFARPDAQGNSLSAHDLIIQWLQVAENYRSFAGKGSSVKEAVGAKVRGLLEEVGCRPGRTDTAVAGKVRSTLRIPCHHLMLPPHRSKASSTKPNMARISARKQDMDWIQLASHRWMFAVTNRRRGKGKIYHAGTSGYGRRCEGDLAQGEHRDAPPSPTDTRPSSTTTNPSPSISRQPASYSTALADPHHDTPEGDSPPRHFESKRQEDLHRRGLAHRTCDTVDAALLNSSVEDADDEVIEVEPPAKRSKPSNKGKSKATKVVADAISSSDHILFGKLDDLRREAADAAKKRAEYEAKRNAEQDALREREVRAREKEVETRTLELRKQRRQERLAAQAEFLGHCRTFPDDWDMAGRLAFGGKEAWSEVAEDMKAYANAVLNKQM